MVKKCSLILYLILSITLHSQTNTATDYKEVDAKIKLCEIWLNEVVDYYHIPGIAVGIVYDTSLVYSNGFGFADLGTRSPVTENTLFRIASISKLFTGTAIMQLRDQGKLNLDDPVKKYI